MFEKKEQLYIQQLDKIITKLQHEIMIDNENKLQILKETLILAQIAISKQIGKTPIDSLDYENLYQKYLNSSRVAFLKKYKKEIIETKLQDFLYKISKEKEKKLEPLINHINIEQETILPEIKEICEEIINCKKQISNIEEQISNNNLDKQEKEEIIEELNEQKNFFESTQVTLACLAITNLVYTITKETLKEKKSKESKKR